MRQRENRGGATTAPPRLLYRDKNALRHPTPPVGCHRVASGARWKDWDGERGIEKVTFPNREISRIDILIIPQIFRFSSHFPEKSKLPHLCEKSNLFAFGGDAIEPDAMTWAVAEGIVEGMDGNLNPAGPATRAQIATILMRFCETVAE